MMESTASMREGVLGEIADVLMGQSPVGSSYNRMRLGAPLINGPTEFTDRYPVPKQWTTAPVRFCGADDVLICVRGSSTGRMNIADQSYCIGRGVAAVRAKRGNDQTFVTYALAAVVSDLLKLQTGSTFPSIDSRVIKGGSLLVPSRREQERIGQALLDADDLIAALERLVAKKRAIKQGIMQQLLTGRTRLPGFSLPWTQVHLGDVGEALIGLTYSPADVKRSGTLVLRSSNVQDGQLSFADNVFVDSPIPSRIRVRENDILICVRNGSRSLIGKSVMLDRRVVGQTFGAFMATYRSPLNPFLNYYFQSDSFKRQIDEHLGATINQITNASLNSFVADMPNDPAERAAIGAVLAEAESEIAKLRARLSKARAVKTGMMQQLLAGRTHLPTEAAR